MYIYIAQSRNISIVLGTSISTKEKCFQWMFETVIWNVVITRRVAELSALITLLKVWYSLQHKDTQVKYAHHYFMFQQHN